MAQIMLCAQDGCRFVSKHFSDLGDVGYCGYHKRRLNTEAVRSSTSMAVVLPRCNGVTKRNARCKRTSSVIAGAHVYCHQHKPPSVLPEQASHECCNLQDDCPICFNTLCSGVTLARTHCGHTFHKDCIFKWRDNGVYGSTCPLCRRNTHMSRGTIPTIQKVYTTIEQY